MSVFFVLGLLAFIFGNLFSDELLITLGWLNLLLLGLMPFIAVGCLRFRIWRIRSGARTAVARHEGSAL